LANERQERKNFMWSKGSGFASVRRMKSVNKPTALQICDHNTMAEARIEPHRVNKSVKKFNFLAVPVAEYTSWQKIRFASLLLDRPRMS